MKDHNPSDWLDVSSHYLSVSESAAAVGDYLMAADYAERAERYMRMAMLEIGQFKNQLVFRAMAQRAEVA